MLAEYGAQAKAVHDSRVAAGKADAEANLQRLGSTAELEAKKSVLAFKQEIIGDVFDDAVKKLANLPKERYVAFLAAQAAQAAVYGTEELIFNQRDAAAVGKEAAKAANALLKEKGIPGGLTVAEETREIPGGVIVRQGDIEYNCAVDTLVQMRRSELASQVAELLFA